jgi:hypothetical protein
MQYTKPDLNVIGVAETLVLGFPGGSSDSGQDTTQNGAFEFEE